MPKEQSRRREQQPINNDQVSKPTKREPNKTGIPDNMKASIEYMSGLSLDKVRVHYNSDKPAEKGAEAYTEGFDVYIAPGQEQHLGHELWHVVQQMRGEVKQTTRLDDGTKVNDKEQTEKEADSKGEEIMEQRPSPVKTSSQELQEKNAPKGVIQRKITTYDLDGKAHTIVDFEGVLEIIGVIFGQDKAAKGDKVIAAITKLLTDGAVFNQGLFDELCVKKEYFLDWSKSGVIASLAAIYRDAVDDHTKEVALIEDSKAYKDLIKLYKDTEADDGHNVGKDYNASLACTLFALLAVKGSYLGANTPEELHHVLQAMPKFQEYDEDNIVGLIRMQAGLSYNTDQKGVTVNDFISSLNDSDRNRKIIVDLDGVAHTFALKYEEGWKRFDNGSSNGYHTGAAIGSNGNHKISVLWE